MLKIYRNLTFKNNNSFCCIELLRRTCKLVDLLFSWLCIKLKRNYTFVKFTVNVSAFLFWYFLFIQFRKKDNNRRCNFSATKLHHNVSTIYIFIIRNKYNVVNTNSKNKEDDFTDSNAVNFSHDVYIHFRHEAPTCHPRPSTHPSPQSG